MKDKQKIIILVFLALVAVLVLAFIQNNRRGQINTNAGFQQRTIEGVQVLEAVDFAQNPDGMFQLHVKVDKNAGLTPTMIQLLDKSTQSVVDEYTLTRSDNQLICEGEILKFDVNFDKYETQWFSEESITARSDYSSSLGQKYSVNVIFDDEYYDSFELTDMCFQMVDTTVTEEPPEDEEEIIFEGEF